MTQAQQKTKERLNAFSNFTLPSYNPDAFASINERNFEALTAANEAISEGAQAIAKRQADIIKSGTESVMQLFQDVCSSTDSPVTHISKHVEFGRTAVENALANMDEMVKIVTKSNTEVLEALTDCFTFAFSEACNMTQSKSSANGAVGKKLKQQEAA